MRRIFTLLIILGSLFTYLTGAAQVTLSPSLPTADQQVTITYDATQGNAALIGATKVYLHSGVVLSSPTGTEWNNTIGNWGVDDGVGEMTSLGNNVWQITVTPSTYYNVPSTDNIFRLAMVFRNATGDIVGKSAADGDIFGEMNPGFYMLIDNPTTSEFFAKTNENVNITATASSNADFQVLVDNVVVNSVNNTASISYNTSFATVGTRIVKVTATNNGVVKEKLVTLQITAGSTIVARPAGVKDGINYIDDNTVILSLLAPGKDIVHVTGDFNSWAIEPAYQMNKTPDSERFWIQINGLTAGQEYIFQYVIDGQIRIADPFTDKVADPWNDQWIPNETYPNLIAYTDTNKGPASVLQTAQTPYNWNIQNFQGVPKNEVMIYEILIRDFTAAHSYQAVRDSMQYLQDMGVNTLHLMPVNEFEGNESWGYNPSFYFAPDKYYGHKDDLKALIDEAHAKGIAVILDLVLNHAFGQNVMARMYWDDANNQPAWDNPWFNQTAPNTCWSWGSDFNHESTYTQNFVDSVNTYWLTEYKVDGFRYDFTKGFTNTQGCGWDYDQSRVDILNRMAGKIWETNPNAYVILEHLAAENEENVLAASGMLPWKRVDAEYKEVISGYQLNTASFSGAQNDGRIVYMESHDEERIMVQNLSYGASEGGYNIQDLPTALDRIALGAAFLYTVPGPKMIWMFGEQGYDYSIDYNGRVGNKPLVWEQYMQDPDRVDLKNTVAALLNLRKDHPVFTQGFFSWDAIGETRKINISHGTMNVTIIGNFSTGTRSIDPSFQHTGTWYNYFSGNAYQNNGDTYLLAAGQWELFTDVQLPLPIGFGGTPVLNDPSNLNASLAGSTINLTWTDNTSIETGYEIERSNTSGSGFSTIATLGIDATSYADASLADGTYYYRVRATGAGATYSGYTNETSEQVGSISGFTVYLKKPSGWSSANVHYWGILPAAALPVSNWPGPVMTNDGGDWYKFTFTGLTFTNLLFNDNSASQTADMTRDKDGWYDNGTWYDIDPRTPLLNDPSNLSVSTLGSQIDLSWSDNTTIETGYQVERSATSGGGFALIATVGVDATSYSDSGLADGTYYYRVRATGAGSTFSGYTNEANGTVGAVTGFTVHLKKPAGWGAATIYYWAVVPSGATTGWPGVTMSDEGDGWYAYTFAGETSTNLIFSDNGASQTADLSRSSDGWYDNGTWTNTKPLAPTGLTIHFKKPASWGAVNMHYWNTTPALAGATTWPGVTMTAQSNDWYTYTIVGATCANIVFNDNGSTQTADLYRCGEGWYDNGWSDTALPVTLYSFEGSMNGNAITLIWETASEVDNDYFDVQRSTDGLNFVTIGRISGVGSSNELIKYNFEDRLTTRENYFYRLLQVDFDGSTSVHPAILIQNEPLGIDLPITLFPNPATRSANVIFELDREQWMSLKLYDLGGNEVNASIDGIRTKGKQQIQINLEGLNKGIYLLRLNTRSSTVSKRLIIE